jgi:hypothetical protein
MSHAIPRGNPARPHARSLGGEAVLHVCSMISNPVRYQSRYRLYHEFLAQNAGNQAEFWTVEVAHGDRPFSVTEPGNPRHLCLRSSDELWHKENALNLLFARVLQDVPDAFDFAWVDADVTFARPDWACETLHQLQHYDVVQMWSHAQDVDHKHRPLPGKPVRSFVWSYYNDPGFRTSPARYGTSSQGHPGYAWAATRKALDVCGGLIDVGICGGGDRHMACGLIGSIRESGPARNKTLDSLTPGFRDRLYAWQDNASALNANIGYVDGLLNHHWHGPKANRKYGDRWQIYTKNQYDPNQDLRRDTQGLYALTPRKPGLRDDLRSYLRVRNEDELAGPCDV